jgi:hypothetical protein
MQTVLRTRKGFEFVSFLDDFSELFVIQQSSAEGNQRMMRKPGGDYLWMGKRGEQAHLNRDIVKEIKRRLDFWLRTGSLKRPRVKTREVTDFERRTLGKLKRLEIENAKLKEEITQLQANHGL